MNNTTTERTRIVVALELDDTAPATWGAAAAFLANPQVELSLLHVVAASARSVRAHSDEAARLVADHHRRVQDLLAGALGSESNPLRHRVEVYIGIGDPAEQIVQLAIDVDASLIVVGTHDRKALERIALGSVSAAVFRRAPCSVLVARRPEHSRRDKSPSVAPPLGAGAPAMVRSPGVVRYRSTPFATYNANLFPTGIPRAQVR